MTHTFKREDCMTDPIPAALREALEAEFVIFGESIGAGGIVKADRARAMAATIRWALHDTPDFLDDPNEWRDWIAKLDSAVDALEQEAENG